MLGVRCHHQLLLLLLSSFTFFFVVNNHSVLLIQAFIPPIPIPIHNYDTTNRVVVVCAARPRSSKRLHQKHRQVRRTILSSLRMSNTTPLIDDDCRVKKELLLVSVLSEISSLSESIQDQSTQILKDFVLSSWEQDDDDQDYRNNEEEKEEEDVTTLGHHDLGTVAAAKRSKRLSYWAISAATIFRNYASNNNGGSKRNLMTRQKLQQSSSIILLQKMTSTSTSTKVVQVQTQQNQVKKKEEEEASTASVFSLALLLATLAIWEMSSITTTSSTSTTTTTENNSSQHSIKVLKFEQEEQSIIRSAASAIASTLLRHEAKSTASSLRGSGPGPQGINIKVDENDEDDENDKIQQQFIMEDLVSALIALEASFHSKQDDDDNDVTNNNNNNNNNDGNGGSVSENNSNNNNENEYGNWIVDLHVLTTLARATAVTACCNEQEAQATTIILQKALMPFVGINMAQQMTIPQVLLPPSSSLSPTGTGTIQQQPPLMLEMSSDSSNWSTHKSRLASALALAAQVKPWEICCPASLIEPATLLDLWHGAEQICSSTIDYYYYKYDDSSSSIEYEPFQEHYPYSTVVPQQQQQPQELQPPTGKIADEEQNQQQQQQQNPVHRLIDCALATKSYRKADTFATQFFDNGGRSRFLTARYLHACDTIGKVIVKGALPVIEKQVQRIDQSVQKLEKLIQEEENYIHQITKKSATIVSSKKEEEEPDDDDNEDEIDGQEEASPTMVPTTTNQADPELEEEEDGPTTLATASQDIRGYAIQQLEEHGNIDAAHRLAHIWDMEYVFDADALEKAKKARRETYLQYDTLLSPGTSIPDVLSTPDELREEWSSFVEPSVVVAGGADGDNNNNNNNKEVRSPVQVFGFDTEFGDDEIPGAALLQISNLERVLLIDIPALCDSQPGREALRDTVGNLFQSSPESCVVVGFACRQDVSKLRQSGIPSRNEGHWLGEVRAMVDLRSLLPHPLGQVGLSRICDHYLGKPLDKSEQCSLWTYRPLTEQQRIYASLDAYVCALIYQRHFLQDWSK